MTSTRRTFIRQVGFTAVSAGLLSSLSADLYADIPFASGELPRSTPEAEGVSSIALDAFFDAIEKSKIEFHSVMVLRHGKVISEAWWNPYKPELKHTLYSLSKSFTSTATGLAINEKHFTLEDTVVSFFPHDLPAEVSENLKTMKIRDLLTMSTGHTKDTIPSMRAEHVSNWAREFLSLPVEFKPGTHFLYNTGATYMLSAIIQRKTGKTVAEYLKPRLFDPLGITGYDWEKNQQGINTGGYGLRIRTEDIAKFGQLYLQKGMWKGKQLIPAAWIEDATQSHIDSSPQTPKRPKSEDDWSQGYGYQFWRCRFGLYRGDGAFGQFCIVMPEKDAVVAITGESFDLQASMNLVWENVLTAMSPAALPANHAAHSALLTREKSREWKAPHEKPASPIANKINGKVFTMDNNPFMLKSFNITTFDDNCVIRFTKDKSEIQVVAYTNRWMITDKFQTQSLFPMEGRPVVDTPLAASATWKDDNTLILSLRYIETAHSDTITFTFSGRGVSISFLNSVSNGNPNAPEKRKPLSGWTD